MFSALSRRTAAVALSMLVATAALAAPAAPSAHAATTTASGLGQQAMPLVNGSAGDDLQEIKKADLVVLFQKVEKVFGGYEWTYTVANAMPNPAHNVVVTKGFKYVSTGGAPTALAAPLTQNLGSLQGYEVREVKIVTTGGTPQHYCVGTSLSAKTSTPEMISTNNSASHAFQ